VTDKSETAPDIMADLCTEIKRLRGLLQGLLDYIDLVDPVISKAPLGAPGDDERIIAAQEALKV
jgi:hypothetical protein